MARAKVEVSLSLLSEVIFGGEVEVVGVSRSERHGADFVTFLIEGHQFPESADGRPPLLHCTVTQKYRTYEFKPVD